MIETFKINALNAYQKGRTTLAANQHLVLLFFIVVLGLSLRLYGIGFDLPNLYHPDEDAVVMPALNILKTGDWRPARLEYGSLHIYTLTAVFAIVYSLLARDGQIPGGIQSLPIFQRGDFPAVYPIPEFFIAARAVSAIMGGATVFLVYLLGVRLGGKRLGLLAAAFTAVSPYHVADAHFSTTDTPLFFWVTLALYLIVRVHDNWESDTVWAFIGAGFIAGLATSTKYNGVVLFVPLIILPFFHLKSLEDIVRFRTVSGVMAMGAGFVAGTPFALLDIPHFLGWFSYALREYAEPTGRTIATWQWHLNFHLNRPHAILFILGMFGFFYSFYKWGKKGVLLNSFALALFYAVLNQTNVQARMWQPASMVVYLWAALVIEWILDRLGEWQRIAQWQQYIQYAPAFLLLPLMLVSMQYGRNFQSGDVRTQAGNWIRTNLPEGTHIAGDYFMPNVNPDKWPSTRSFHLYQNDVSFYQQQGVEYLILNEALLDFNRFSPELIENYETMLEQVCLVETINGSFLGTTNFDIKVYQTPPCTG
ncbi:MAG: glycosyltransferase family 39 protein [Chloroflexota bacterium]